VRVKTEVFTYSGADRVLQQDDSKLALLEETAGLLAFFGDYADLIKHQGRSKTIVNSFMIAGNMVADSVAIEREWPWLHRNHGEEAVQAIKFLSEADRGLFSLLRRAVYQPDPGLHEAMRKRGYCHVTSGLRRFPDTANGLNLDALIEGKDPYYDREDMAAISQEQTEMSRKELTRRLKKDTKQGRTILRRLEAHLQKNRSDIAA
jgi:hypothetical protein